MILLGVDKADGCMKMLPVRGQSAEPSGYLFCDDGRSAYVSVRHSGDAAMPQANGFGTDEVIRITGLKFPQRHHNKERDHDGY